MNNKTVSQEILSKKMMGRRYNLLNAPTAISTIFESREKTQSIHEKPSEPKQKIMTVSKYELSDNKVKFFAIKGLMKKKVVIINEIPIQEITSIESFGNELTLSWEGIVYKFVLKNKSKSFSELCGQIKDQLEEQLKIMSKNKDTNIIKMELIENISASRVFINILFNILINFHQRRVDWSLLESYSQRLENGLSLTGKIFVSFELNFSEIVSAVKRQNPKETIKKTYNALVAIFEYFNNLNPTDYPNENSPDIESSKTVILTYYTLNDLLLGRIIDDKDAINEGLLLNKIISQYIIEKTNDEVKIEKLNDSLNRLGVEGNLDDVIEESRAIFTELMKI